MASARLGFFLFMHCISKREEFLSTLIIFSHQKII